MFDALFLKTRDRLHALSCVHAAQTRVVPIANAEGATLDCQAVSKDALMGMLYFLGKAKVAALRNYLLSHVFPKLQPLRQIPAAIPAASVVTRSIAPWAGTETGRLPPPAEERQTMTSREIAELAESRHDNVMTTVERLAHRGVVTLPALKEVPNCGPGPKTVKAYVIGKRDTYVVVAQLSPEFTGRLVDRWQELEAQVKHQALPAPAAGLFGDLAQFQRMLDDSIARAVQAFETKQRELVSERIRAGMARARAEGKVPGRKAKMTA